MRFSELQDFKDFENLRTSELWDFGISRLRDLRICNFRVLISETQDSSTILSLAVGRHDFRVSTFAILQSRTSEFQGFQKLGM